ncbi:uncharacterized protein LOC111031015 [Myzus persicae]|uniref:uncharacterized protein LOC111031015 n=1 Tax=Myzus persicae TaxID=13164 RepID=UPI000B9363DA|nr:uncharacterized protein LOC111031015 [Myzus persicae]
METWREVQNSVPGAHTRYSHIGFHRKLALTKYSDAWIYLLGKQIVQKTSMKCTTTDCMMFSILPQFSNSEDILCSDINIINEIQVEKMTKMCSISRSNNKNRCTMYIY